LRSTAVESDDQLQSHYVDDVESSSEASGERYENIPVADPRYYQLKDQTDVTVISKASEKSRSARHNQLTNQFHSALKGKFTVIVGTSLSAMFDMNLYNYFEDRDLLIEAKGSMERAELRLAIGQLYDYRWSGFEKDPDNQSLIDMAVLLPERPDDNTIAMLRSADVAILWVDNAGIHCTNTDIERRLRTAH
jgi:hypothetical protein